MTSTTPQDDKGTVEKQIKDLICECEPENPHVESADDAACLHGDQAKAILIELSGSHELFETLRSDRMAAVHAHAAVSKDPHLLVWVDKEGLQ